MNDCGKRHYTSWFQLLSPCFKEKLKGEDILHPELCLPEPHPKLKQKVHSIIENFNTTIQSSKKLLSLASSMIVSVPDNYKDVCPSTFDEFISYLKLAAITSPSYLPGAPDHIGCPLQNLFLCLLQSPHGRDFFNDPEVNEAVRDVVDVYGELLRSPDSRVVFNNRQFGRMSDCAKKDLRMEEFDLPAPDELAWGFDSFNSWFTRSLKNFAKDRPCPEDPRSLVAVGDVQWYADATGLELETQMYIKNESYSLLHMFGGTEEARLDALPFVGGALLQVFFSADKYHHFHSPTSGKILKVRTMPGRIHETTFKISSILLYQE